MRRRLPTGARPLVRLGSVRRDLDDELAFHFEQTVSDLMRDGYSANDAREEAARRFGDEQQYRRDLATIDSSTARVRRWSDRVDTARQMVTQAVRSIVRAPGLTAGVVVALALGIGANATMFGILDRLLLRAPAHIVDADQVRLLFVDQMDQAGQRYTDPTLSYPDYIDFTRVDAFADVAAGSGRQLTLGTGGEAREVSAELVTANYFPLLGVQPAIGRFIDATADRVGGSAEAVLSYGMWQREYGGESSVIGRSIDFGYGPYTIVGVTPRGFTGTGLGAVDMWLPLRQAATPLMGGAWESEADGARGWQWLATVARLRPGVTIAQAEAEATAAHRTARAADIAAGDWGREPRVIAASVIAARAPNAPGSAAVARLLTAVSVMVLLIACVNVANLLLARAIRQRREIAVRLALGISRRRLVGQIVLEGVLLALLGGAAAIALERWAGAVVRQTLLPDVAWDEIGASELVLPLTIGLALIAGVISALVPALQVARRDVADTIRAATGGGISRGTTRARNMLALAQTALSVILLVGAGLFVRSLENVRNLDLGFDTENLLFAEMRTASEGIGGLERRAVFLTGIDRIAQVPGVSAVAVSSTMPFRARRTESIRAQGVDSIMPSPSGGPFVHAVTPSYFDAMSISIVRGRTLEAGDIEGRQPVVVIGQRFAEWLWRDENPIGKCLYLGRADTNPPCTIVVGVAENASNIALREPDILQYYVPLAQTPAERDRGGFWFVRTVTDDASMAAAVRREIEALDSRIRFANVEPYQDRIDPETRAWTLGATMFGIFGMLALLVAGIGLYSVLSFDVAQRTRELGLRTALGASAATLVRSVVTRAVALTTAGLILGGSAAILLAPRVEAMLFDTSARDPLTYAVVIATLLLVAVAAASIPAWRATRVDPNVSLRD